jgi:transposase
MSGDVMIAAGPDKAGSTAAVLGPVTKTLIEAARFAGAGEGCGQLVVFAARWGHRRWAVEGCHGAGRSLAQRLAADGELVLDVPAKLAARVRVYSRGHGRKTDKHDAVPIGLAALDGTGVLPVARDDVTVSLRLLCDRREELAAQRTQAVCRLHRLLAELTPGGMRRELTANKARALPARIRPAGEVAEVRLHIARDHPADIRALDARLKYLTGQIAALVTESGTTLTTLYGAGPLIAGRILAEAGDGARFATKDKFASYNGTAPIDASSGDQPRHRLSRAGNRRINHALHMMAVTQIRYPGPGLLRAQARGRQDALGGPALPAAPAAGCGLPAARPGPARHNRSVPITYDAAADAVYIHLTGQPLSPGRTTIQAGTPAGLTGFIALDRKDGRRAGIEALDAGRRLPPDILEEAEVLS